MTHGKSVVVPVGGGYDASDVRYGLHLIANEDCDEVAASYYAKKALAHLSAPAPSSLAGGEVFDVEAYVADYEFRGDDGDFTPNAWQRVMLTDAIHGVLAAMPSGQASREVREAIVTAIAFINRDHGTDRLNDTVTALMPKLVRADAILRGQA